MTLPPVRPQQSAWSPGAYHQYDSERLPPQSYPSATVAERPQGHPVDHSVPSAPFANAGPPGFQFYPAGQQQPSPNELWHHGRRL